MADGHGGYRKPANPAAVSGPGKYSRRTDTQPKMRLPNAEYGEQQAYQEAQSAGPLAKVAGAVQGASAPPAPAADPLAGLTGLGAPSTMPDMPVTDGAALGPGSTPEPASPVNAMREDAQAMAPYLNAMIRASQQADATPAFRKYVRRLIANSN